MENYTIFDNMEQETIFKVHYDGFTYTCVKNGGNTFVDLEDFTEACADYYFNEYDCTIELIREDHQYNFKLQLKRIISQL